MRNAAVSRGALRVRGASMADIFGDDGDNTLVGTDGNDVLVGLGGNDSLVGLDGNVDQLDGGAGADTMAGGDGFDVYWVDDLNDQVIELPDGGYDRIFTTVSFTLPANVEELLGQPGSYIVGYGNELDNFMLGHTGDTLYGLKGNDTLEATGSSVLIGGVGDDEYIVQTTDPQTLTENPGEGIDIALVAISDFTLPANFEILHFNADLYNAYTGVGNDTDNLMLADFGSVNFSGLDGNDTLLGNWTGDDFLDGGAGNDSLDGGDGRDTLNGDEGHDTLSGGEGDDYLKGSIDFFSPDDDVLIGGNGNDTLQDYAGNNSLDGGDGDDLFYDVSSQASSGANTMTGGAGHDFYSFDTFFFNSPITPDVITDFETGPGGDVMNITSTDVTNFLTGFPADANPFIAQYYRLLQTGSDTLLQIDHDGPNGPENFVTIVNLKNTVVTDFTADNFAPAFVPYAGVTIIGNSSANLIDATHTVAGQPLPTIGGDSIDGGSGNDTIYALGGDDTITGGTGTDSMIGGLGKDLYVVDAGGDKVFENANEGTDSVQSSVSYTLPSNVEALLLTGVANLNGTGNTGDESITGNSGNNILAGLSGADVLDGGDGSDTATYAASSAAVKVMLATGTSTTGMGTGGDAEGDTLLQIENLTGSNFDDTLGGDAGNNILNGGNGNDTLSYEHARGGVTVNLSLTTAQNTGSSGIDTVAKFENLMGSGFDDSLTGSGSNNFLMGLDGNDRLINGGGSDTLDGGAGADSMAGGAGNDVYVIDNPGDVVTEANGAGNDTIQTTLNVYSLAPLANVENLTVIGTGDFAGTGNSLNNALNGGAGNDTLDGGSGNDKLLASEGDDQLLGGAGNDTITGGAGADTMTGGIGADRFVFTAISDFAMGANLDTVLDFAHSQTDKIDVSAINGKENVAGSHFTFIGAAAFSNAAGELHYVANGSGGVNVEGDANGDGVADLTLVVNGVASLVGGDFIL
jgi:Ca2+-binding RTX toxin-like protein